MEMSGKVAAERRCQADELAKQRDAATKLVEERQRRADESGEKARDKPNDERLQRAKEEKQKAYAEARTPASGTSVAYDESRKQADAVRAKADMATLWSIRAKKAGRSRRGRRRFSKVPGYGLTMLNETCAPLNSQRSTAVNDNRGPVALLTD